MHILLGFGDTNFHLTQAPSFLQLSMQIGNVLRLYEYLARRWASLMTLKQELRGRIADNLHFEVWACGSGFLYLIAVIRSTMSHVFGNTSQELLSHGLMIETNSVVIVL